MKKLPPLKRFQTLTQDQRDQIVAWLEEGKSYRWIIKQTAKPLDQGGFGEPVPKTCLWRFNKRRLAVQSGTVKKSFGDLSQIASDINHYAATGECGAEGTGFHSATVHLIEKQALELALDQSDHDRLKDLFRMKLAHENSQTKKTYNTHRIELENQKLDHRKEINTARLALDNRKQELREKQFEHQKSIDEKKFPAPEPPPKPLTLQQQQERIWDIFHIPEEERVRRRALAGWTAANPGDTASSTPIATSVGKSATAASGSTLSQTKKHNENPEVRKNTMPPIPSESPDFPLLVVGAARTESQGESVRSSVNPRIHPSANPHKSHSSHNSHSSHPDSSTVSPSQSEIENRKPKMPECPLCNSAEPHLKPVNLAARSNAYTVRRAEEYWGHRRAEDAWYEEQANRPYLRGGPPQYNSKLRECPCGSEIPCPHHEEFSDRFWRVSPHDTFYAQSLRDRDIPYRDPREFSA
jgi:hypothetical protein